MNNKKTNTNEELLAQAYNIFSSTLADYSNDENITQYWEERIIDWTKEYEERFQPFSPSNPPKKGEEYYTVSNVGVIVSTTWDNYTGEKFALATGNVFRTEKEAEKAIAEKVGF